MEKIKLKTARKKAGLSTQAEVAEILNLTVTTISNYETGKSSPSYATAKKMAELYGVQIDDLDFSTEQCSVKSE